MNRKFYQLIVLVVLGLFSLSLLAGCGSSKPAPAKVDPAKKFVFKLGHTASPDHHYQVGSLKFAELVAKKTKGNVEIKVFPADQLGKQRQLVEGAQLGTVDMVLTSDVLLSGFEPLVGALNLPFLFKDMEHVSRVLEGPAGKKLDAALAKKNLVVIAWWENGFRHITNSRKPINVPEDLKGLKIRVPEGNVFVETFNSYGASATPMSFGELYSALQLKTVDGQENPTTHVLTQKYYEVQKYLSITNHIHVAEPLLMSAKIYKTLPAEYQKALMEAGKEVAVWMMKEIGAKEAKEIEEIKKKGMIINTANAAAFKEASKKVYTKFEPVFGKDFIDAITNSK
jgi:tripartite ATP-independent transporter DctP family solute receptor